MLKSTADKEPPFREHSGLRDFKINIQLRDEGLKTADLSSLGRDVGRWPKTHPSAGTDITDTSEPFFHLYKHIQTQLLPIIPNDELSGHHKI